MSHVGIFPYIDNLFFKYIDPQLWYKQVSDTADVLLKIFEKEDRNICEMWPLKHNRFANISY